MVADAPGRRSRPGAEACCENNSRRVAAASSVRPRQGGGNTVRGEYPGLLGVPGVQAVGCQDAGITLSGLPAATAEGCMILRGQETIAVPLGHNTCYECLLLHPRLGTQRPRHIMQIPDFVPLICRKGRHVPGVWERHEVNGQPRLGLQRRLQLGRQGLAPLTGPAQDTQAGFPAQIVFSGR